MAASAPQARLRIVVDRQLSEVLSPDLLHRTLAPSWPQLARFWWWQRGWRRRARQVVLGGGGAALPPGCTLEFAERRPWPRYPEDKLDARYRFQQALEHWAGACAGRDVLVVAHGDVSRAQEVVVVVVVVGFVAGLGLEHCVRVCVPGLRPSGRLGRAGAHLSGHI